MIEAGAKFRKANTGLRKRSCTTQEAKARIYDKDVRATVKNTGQVCATTD
jgi:hypothetical protein